MLTIVRDVTSDAGTFSEWYWDWERICSAIELPWRNNTRRVSCIPDGEYTVIRNRSPKFGAGFIFLDVPGRSFVLIHKGNFAGAAPWKTHSHGCLLPGMGRGKIWNGKEMQPAIISSAVAFSRLLATLPNEFQTTIIEV